MLTNKYTLHCTSTLKGKRHRLRHVSTDAIVYTTKLLHILWHVLVWPTNSLPGNTQVRPLLWTCTYYAQMLLSLGWIAVIGFSKLNQSFEYTLLFKCLVIIVFYRNNLKMHFCFYQNAYEGPWNSLKELAQSSS